MIELNRINKRELRNAYKTIPNMKCKTFEEFIEMLTYWCQRCPKKRTELKRGE